MYDVYIKNYKENNDIIETEKLMFTVPSSGGFPVLKPVVKQDEDSADKFQFTMESNSEYYDSLQPLKTMIRVVYDGTIIFMGRVLSISTSTVFNTKNVTCEGVMSYFNDTYYEGKQDKYRKEITIEQYYTKLIDNHNSQAPEKKIKKGTIGVTLKTEKQKYEPSSWTQTFSGLNSLTNSYGGHFCIRYSGTTPYLDWYKYYVRDLGDGVRPSVVVGKNIIDISSDSNVSDIFTRVIPIGGSNNNGKNVYIDGYKYKDKNGTEHTHSGKSFPISKVLDLYTNSQLTDEFHNYKDYRDAESLYGVIYKTIDFSDAKTQSKLWSLTKAWVKDCYFGLCSSFTVKAIDMHIKDKSNQKILLGDCVDIVYKINQNGSPTWVTKKLVCKSVQYDLFNPENNSYTFGIPTDLLENNKINKKSTKKTESQNGAKKPYTPGTNDESWTFEKVAQLIGALDSDPEYEGMHAKQSFEQNGESLGTVMDFYDPDEKVDTGKDGDDVTVGSNPQLYKDHWFKGRTIGKITLTINGVKKPTKWVAVSEARGIFAYKKISDPNPVAHWYYHKPAKTTATYSPSDSSISTFEKIAKMIEEDENTTYGGTQNAESFRSYSRISGTARCYDPDKTGGSVPSSAAGNEDKVFIANIVGKFKVGNVSMKWVAVSKEFGVFAFYYGPSQYQPVRHWYLRGSGAAYDNTGGTTTQETKDGDGNIKVTITTTDDGTPGGKPVTETDPTGSDGEGTVKVGYNPATGAGWRIYLNKTIMYKDKDGKTVTKSGFVSAEDFNLEEIPSFYTKLAVIDHLVAGKIDAHEINSDISYIRLLNSDEISVGTRVAAVQVKCNNLIASTVQCSDVSLPTGPNGRRYHLTDCFVDGSFSESDGKITLTLNRASRSNAWTDSFNMADTQFYKDAVSASKNTGWNAAKAVVTGGLPMADVSGLPTSYNIHVPNNNYGSGYFNYELSISDLTEYSYSGVKIPVFNVKLGSYVACRKELKLKNMGSVDPPTTDAETYTVPNGYHGIGSITIKPADVAGARNTGWNAARAIIDGSIPDSSNEAVNTNTAWELRIPKTNYGDSKHYNAKSLTISNPTEYQPPGSSTKLTVVNAKIGNYVAYRKEVKLENKTITPSSSKQTLHASGSNWGFGTITVPKLSIGSPSISASRNVSGTILNIKSALVSAAQNNGYVIITFSVNGASGVSSTYYIKASDII